MEEMQPGQVFSPRDPSTPPASNGAGAPEPERPAEPTPEPTPAPAPTPEPVPAQDMSEPTPDTAWAYHQEPVTGAAPVAELPENVSWTASEFVAHDKGAGWYMALSIAGLAAATIDYWLTKDVFSTGVILFATIAFGYFAGRKPRSQQYGLDRKGVWVGNRLYGYQDFKSFSPAEEGGVQTIVFMPLKRFMPSLTIYVAPEVGDTVLDYLASFLPFEQQKNDAIDSLMRRIRF